MRNCLQCNCRCEKKFCNDYCRKMHILKLREELDKEYSIKSNALKEKNDYIKKYNSTHLDTY